MSIVATEEYAERVYAGVLGKVIGVYLGRPFEGWTYERIQRELGDIEYYVHDKLGQPLIVTDDDISGTFTFARALADNNFDSDITAREIGEAWMNYLVEDRTILWWGGLGNSTEHTAYLRMKAGIEAPESGSAALNGKVVSEQIGAQIFIDGWAMVSPGDAQQAARLAEAAARVSHDGEAVYGAIVLAVMEAMAFVESDINKLLDKALSFVPASCLITRLIDDVRAWHNKEPDWRATREQLENVYGYDKYGGNCHMIPNHGLIVHSLLHGEDDFSQTMKIINTCGWDTDCNSGNVGCLMGIKNGITGIDQKPEDWRGPVADRIYIPTADPTWSISDCGNEALFLVNTARQLAGQEMMVPKRGAQFHFTWPGSVQGFTVTHGDGEVTHANAGLHLTGNAGTRFGTPVFTPSKDVAKTFERSGYALLASPRIYPGQTLYADFDGRGQLYAAYYGDADHIEFVRAEEGAATLQVPEYAHPVFEVGLELTAAEDVHLDALGWRGVPSLHMTRPKAGSMWRRAWVNAVDDFWSFQEPFRIMQNSGVGLLIQGSREWTDYVVIADVTPHLAKSAGVAARVQGMRRYYAVRLAQANGETCLQLIKMHNEITVLAQAPFDWEFGETYALSLSVEGAKIVAQAGDVALTSTDAVLSCGGIALLIEEGRTATENVSIRPVS